MPSECLLAPPIDTTAVQHFLSVELAEEALPAVRVDVVRHFFALFPSTSLPDELKAAALRHIVTPMMRASLSQVCRAYLAGPSLHGIRRLLGKGTACVSQTIR